MGTGTEVVVELEVRPCVRLEGKDVLVVSVEHTGRGGGCGTTTGGVVRVFETGWTLRARETIGQMNPCWVKDLRGIGTPGEWMKGWPPEGREQLLGSVCCHLRPPGLQEHRGLLAIRYPMEHGVVRDWNDMERIWQYVYSKDQLQTFSEEVGPQRPPSAPPAASASGLHTFSGLQPLPPRIVWVGVPASPPPRIVWVWVRTASGCQVVYSRGRWVFGRLPAGR